MWTRPVRAQEFHIMLSSRQRPCWWTDRGKWGKVSFYSFISSFNLIYLICLFIVIHFIGNSANTYTHIITTNGSNLSFITLLSKNSSMQRICLSRTMPHPQLRRVQFRACLLRKKPWAYQILWVSLERTDKTKLLISHRQNNKLTPRLTRCPAPDIITFDAFFGRRRATPCDIWRPPTLYKREWIVKGGQAS